MPATGPGATAAATATVTAPTAAAAAAAAQRTLASVTAALAGGGEPRPGQVDMTAAVARAIADRRHLVVQAGTGTGKSLAYLVPAALAGRRVVVATATKALQDQLAGTDLPFLETALGRPLRWAVLKGRSNYVCMQRVAEIGRGESQGTLALDGLAGRAPTAELSRLRSWAASTATGDRAELDVEPSATAWAAVSVGSRECPGADRCPSGGACFAERARARAQEADVVVVNTHLYGLHLENGRTILPDHDVVVIDEAHQLEEVVSATFGVEIGGGRFAHLRRVVGAIVDDAPLLGRLEGAGSALAAALAHHVGRRLRGTYPDDVGEALGSARSLLAEVDAALRAVPTDRSDDVASRTRRAQRQTGALSVELDACLDVPGTHVAWVEGPAHAASLRVAPVDVAATLADALWPHVTVVLTSATIAPGLPGRLGAPPAGVEVLDVGSPFDYAANALLYCAADLPDPRAKSYEAAMHAELVELIRAAGGRTLALFTSWRAMEAAAEAARARLDLPILTQRELPKPALVSRFRAEPETSLFATMGFWQGVDVPGASLSLVAIDRIPFPRPDEPLLQARRERARGDAFRVVDLPRAATLLAQGAGRLIRTATDRGVVAVLDPRLATQAAYRWDIVRALPPMRRTRDRAEALAELRSLHEADERARATTG
ncbi:MAG: ATP-dependent DNA helicase [Actinobacteria bacterium]|nr:ATP-dependent DNA helicase [Actinomycetota bacterium]